MYILTPSTPSLQMKYIYIYIYIYIYTLFHVLFCGNGPSLGFLKDSLHLRQADLLRAASGFVTHEGLRGTLFWWVLIIRILLCRIL